MDDEKLARELSDLMEAEAPDLGAMLFKKHCRNKGLDPRSISKDQTIVLIRPLIDTLRPIIGPKRSEKLHQKMLKATGLDGALDDPEVLPGIKITILTEMAKSQSAAGELELAKKMYKRAILLAEENNYTARRVEILRWIGYMEADLGSYDRAHVIFNNAYDNCPDDELEEKAHALCGMGYVNWKLAKYSEAEDIFRKGIRKMQKMGEDRDVELLGQFHTNLANVLDETGRTDEAAEEYQVGIGYLKETRSLSELAKAYNNLGDLKMNLGLFDEAAANFMLCRQVSEKLGDVIMVAWADFNLAEAYIRADLLDKAYYLLERAKGVLERGQDKQGQAALLRTYGMYYGSLENWEECDQSFRHALGIYHEIDLPHSHAVTLKEYSRYLGRQGRTDEAAKHAHEASAIFSDLGLDDEAAQVLSLL